MNDEKHLKSYQYDTTIDGKTAKGWAQRANLNHFEWANEMRKKGFIYHETKNEAGVSLYYFERNRYGDEPKPEDKKMHVTINGKKIYGDSKLAAEVPKPTPFLPGEPIFDEDDLPF